MLRTELNLMVTCFLRTYDLPAYDADFILVYIVVVYIVHVLLFINKAKFYDNLF